MENGGEIEFGNIGCGVGGDIVLLGGKAFLELMMTMFVMPIFLFSLTIFYFSSLVGPNNFSKRN